MLIRLWWLIRKELQALFGNTQGRFLLIMPVLLQTALFPFAAASPMPDVPPEMRTRFRVSDIAYAPLYGKMFLGWAMGSMGKVAASPRVYMGRCLKVVFKSQVS